MRKKILIIAGLVGIFFLFVLVRFFLFDRPTASGRLRIVSSPNATVFINNEPLGKTPYEGLRPVGSYQIKLIPEGSNTQAVPWEGTIEIAAQTLTYIERDLGSTDVTSSGGIYTIRPFEAASKGTGALSVSTNPAGAIIYLNNDEKGIAPSRLIDIPEGDYELSIQAPGFFRKTSRLKITNKSEVFADIKLALDTAHKTLDSQIEEATREIDATESASVAEDEAKSSSASASSKITILDTPTGWLNVRDEPSLSGKQIDQVRPKQTFIYLKKQGNWYQIRLSDGTEGWVSGEYAEEE